MFRTITWRIISSDKQVDGQQQELSDFPACRKSAARGLGTIVFQLRVDRVEKTPRLITWVVEEPFSKSEAHRTNPKNILNRIVRGECLYRPLIQTEVLELMSRKSKRLEKVNEPDSENNPELNPGRSRITRQKKVDKSSTSARVQRRRALSSASGDSDQEEYLLHPQIPAIEEADDNSEPGQLHRAEGELESINNPVDIFDEKEDSVEWDSAYDKGSPLKDDSDILDLTVTRVADQTVKDRSLSVAVNTAPEDFALDNPDSFSTDLPVPTLHNVHGLAIVLETSEEVERGENSEGEEEELRELELRLEKLNGTSMEERYFQQRIKDLRKMEIKIVVMLEEFTPDHVTYEDRESYKEKLVRIGGKYSKWRDESTDLIADLDPSDATDEGRIATVKAKMSEIVKLVADHAKGVKMKVTEVVAAQVANAPPAQPVEVAHPLANGNKKKDLANKMKRKAARMETAAKDLIRKTKVLQQPADMLERDLRREITVEFLERDKECKEIRESVHDILDNLATIDEELNLRDVPAEVRLNNLVDEMKEVVEERKVLVRSLDKSLGLCTEYPNPSKTNIPTPEVYEGKPGTNVYKFKEKILEYVEAAQIRAKDKAET